MKKRTNTFIAVFLVTGLVLGVCWANELQNGSFDLPDNEGWDGSSWSIWTDTGRSGRPVWASRLGGGRGAAAWGWADTSAMGIYQDVPGAAHVVYTFKVWIKKEINYNENNTQMNIEWLDNELNRLYEDIYTNLTGQVGPTYSQFYVSGSTTNTNCAIARVVIDTSWTTPTNTIYPTIQFDDAELISVPATVIQMK